MKQKAALLMLLLAASTAAFPQPTLITFEGMPRGQGTIPTGYSGFNWTLQYVDAINYPLNPSGYLVGLISGNYVAFGTELQWGFTNSTSFDLDSAYLTAAWSDNLQLHVTGSLNGTLLYDNTYTLSATTPTLITFNYLGVDTVMFAGSGGTHHSGYTGSGKQFAMDNLTVTIPEPGFGSLIALCAATAAFRRVGNKQSAV